MSITARLRLLCFSEILLLLVAVGLGMIPGSISFMSLDFGVTWSRMQVMWSMLMSGPVLLLLLAGLISPGKGLRVQGLLAAFLLFPSAVAAVLTMTQDTPPPYFDPHLVLRILFVLLPLIPIAFLVVRRGDTSASTRDWAIVMAMVGLGGIINLAAGFWAFVEIGTWV
ncbi:MAG: hypothetical protein ACI8RZ_001805 [Myxococcota bacterium]|jgi:hypothetical protein